MVLMKNPEALRGPDRAIRTHLIFLIALVPFPRCVHIGRRWSITPTNSLRFGARPLIICEGWWLS